VFAFVQRGAKDGIAVGADVDEAVDDTVDHFEAV
jgi:hypothetical protein